MSKKTKQIQNKQTKKQQTKNDRQEKLIIMRENANVTKDLSVWLGVK